MPYDEITDAVIERSWRNLVETGSSTVDFYNHDDGEAWRSALRKRARKLGRKIGTMRGRSDDPTYPLLELRCMAWLKDWEDPLPEDERERRTAEALAGIFSPKPPGD